VAKEKEKGAGQTSIYFNEEDHAVLAELQARTGLGRSGVIRWALHNAHKEGDTAQIEQMAKIRAAAEEIVSLTQT
jgi:hypothetical protein